MKYNKTKGTAIVRSFASRIRLSSSIREALEQLVRKRSSPQQLVTRTKRILVAAQGKVIRETARVLPLGPG
jgi:hypothetical protein